MANKSPPHMKDRNILPVSIECETILNDSELPAVFLMQTHAVLNLHVSHFHKTSLLIPVTKFFC